MDMGVTVGAAGDERQPAKPAVKNIARGANSSDLDAWLEKVEALGELKRITAEVDPDLEAATITISSVASAAPRCCSRTSRAIPVTARSTTWWDATCRASA